MDGKFVLGQLWISTMEPELGLGLITELDKNKIKIYFATSKIERYYSAINSPLKRVRFRVGEKIKTKNSQQFTIDSVEEVNELFYYCSGELKIPETEVSDTMSFLTPLARLSAGHIDPINIFQLRTAMLEFNCHYHRSFTKGFLGPRIRILPHQFYIAQAAAARQTQRFLLADEVGLGKTIEACLTMHHLLIAEKVQRVLIVVPDSLMYQWFVELYRKFNLSFTIFDENFYISAKRAQPQLNPFITQQLGLTIFSFIFFNPNYAQELLSAGWDLVIVDEVHRLPEASPAYAWLKQLAAQTPNVLLLTATPEVLGYQSLFAICRLLYPDIYKDYANFLEHTKSFSYLADIIEKIESIQPLADNELKWLENKLYLEIASLNALRSNDYAQQSSSLIEALLANYGLGHLIFRNTRQRINIFPQRRLNLAELSLEDHENVGQKELIVEFQEDAGLLTPRTVLDYTNDHRIKWLILLLKNLSEKKILLICHTKQKVIAIQKALLNKININLAIFHEDLTLIQRDRMAAYFAEENGAQLLICSEIGSEGRNFQFAQHLVFFDYPLDLELIEQRIGRLDRIGQTGIIQLHLPYIKNSPQEALVHWLNEACQAFTSLYSFGNRLISLFREKLIGIALSYPQIKDRNVSGLNELIERTKLTAQQIAAELAKTRDRLLARNSFAPNVVQRLTKSIETQDISSALSKIMYLVFEYFDLNIEEITLQTWLLKASSDYSDILPGFRGEQMVVTFDRPTALVREDYLFLTWDHPMVRGAFDLFLGSEKGNCSFAHWADGDEQNIYLEAFFLIECIAPVVLPVSRYLHLAPVRVLVDSNELDCTDDYTHAFLNKRLQQGNNLFLNELLEHGTEKIEQLIEQAQQLAEIKLQKIIAESIIALDNEYMQIMARETYLQKVNPHLSKNEIDKTKEQQQLLKQYLAQSRLRLDTIRLVWRG